MSDANNSSVGYAQRLLRKVSLNIEVFENGYFRPMKYRPVFMRDSSAVEGLTCVTPICCHGNTRYL